MTTRPRSGGCPRSGEARVIATRPGGVSGVVVARNAGTVVVASATLPGGDTRDEDERRRKERKDRKISAILHETYPVRYWDHESITIRDANQREWLAVRCSAWLDCVVARLTSKMRTVSVG